MPITITSNTPLEINGAPFTGLMFLSPGPGQTEWFGGCCNSGDCYAIAFVDGIYQAGYVTGAGQCPAQYLTRDPDFIEPSAAGSYYNLGYKWGDPDDLLANLCQDGCCSSMALTLPDATVDFSEFGQYSQPRRTYTASMADLEAQVTALQAQVAALTPGSDAQTEAADSTAAQIAAMACEAVPVSFAQDDEDCETDCGRPMIGR